MPLRSDSIKQQGGVLAANVLDGLTECGTEVELEGRNGFYKPGDLRGWGFLLTAGFEKAAKSL